MIPDDAAVVAVVDAGPFVRMIVVAAALDSASAPLSLMLPVDEGLYVGTAAPDELAGVADELGRMVETAELDPSAVRLAIRLDASAGPKVNVWEGRVVVEAEPTVTVTVTVAASLFEPLELIEADAEAVDEVHEVELLSSVGFGEDTVVLVVLVEEIPPCAPVAFMRAAALASLVQDTACR